MAKPANTYKRSFTKSIGSGIGSVFGGTGKQYYILEHKLNSRYHKAGESQEIIVDNIEIGRDARCQVRFDESFSTISRRHAAIVRDADNWKLVHLSETNPTILNGKKISKEWYLQNGDEIELSAGGPRLGFIIPTGKKSTIASIGLTRRLSLFRQQALRPYKQAITLLSIVLVLAVGGMSAWMAMQNKEHAALIAALRADALKQEEVFNSRFAAQGKALEDEKERNEALRRETEKQIADLQGIVRNNPGNNPGNNPNVTPSQTDNGAITRVEPHVYFIIAEKIELIFPDGEAQEVEFGLTGTGFLLNDGRFVTARHVTEPWFYFIQSGQIDDKLLALNIIANNGGRVIAHLRAFSSSGEQFSFKSDSFTCDRRKDAARVDENGLRIRLATAEDADWSSIKTSKTQGLTYDAKMSASLERGTHLTVLGFPMGIGANSPTDITPQLSEGKTTANGLTNGVIITANTSYEQGNSGGPVFYQDASGNLQVVGIVSAGAGRSTGFIVPIAAIDRN